MHYARSQPDIQSLQPNGIRRTRSVTAHSERISSSRRSSKSPNATVSKALSNNAHTQAFSELLPLNMIVQERDGQVLGKSMVLKTDRFPTEVEALPDLEIHVTDAPNFRQIGDEPIFAVGQPSRHSIRTILNLLKGKTVRWISLREEPIVYLNNRPFVLRELAHPFRNMKDFAGIDYQRLEQIEARLKEDILIEAQRNRGNILVHDEVSKHHVRPCWESVTPSSVKTSREVFEYLGEKGYKITYSRIPITPESVFDAKDIDHLIRVFFYSLHSNSEGVHVFSCQMGGGRSTLGTIVMRLLFMRFGLIDSSRDTVEDGYIHQESANIRAYQRGEYPVIRRLLRVLYHGQEAKDDIDIAVNACGAVHNVRNAVLETRMLMEVASDDNTAYLYAKNTALRIQRYFMLICFGAYLRKYFEPGDLNQYVGKPQIKLPAFTFEMFMKENYELGKLAEQCVSEEQLATFVPLSSDSIGKPESESDLIVSKRQGSVLGKNMMLKSVYILESVSDQEQPSSLSAISGHYPNFFIVPGLALAALGLPDVNGLLSAIDRLSRQVVPAQAIPTVVWISLVSEPILYIDSTPFVLRDYFHSFRTLKEFEVGLTSARLAEIEHRLKDDTLKEIEQNESSILLHFEASNSRIRPIVFPVSDPTGVVETTSEVFSNVSNKRSDIRLVYKHVPLQAFGAPTGQSFDLLIETIISSLVPGSAICFNCQHGRGRSSVAVSISLLIMMHMGLIHLKSPSEISELVAEDSDHCLPDSLQLGCKAVLSLTRILKNGRQIVREVDSAIAMCGKIYHLRDVIFDARMRWETERVSQGQSDVYLEKCVQYLQRYAYIVCINSYLHDRFKGKLPVDTKFSTWLADRGEIGLWMENCRNHPLDAVKFPAILATNQNAQVFENRTGSVLVPLSVLKGDYFPGAQRQDLLPILEGAPNFRFIESMRIVGVAVPTKVGVQNVISEVKRHQPDIDFVWMNLREEPLLYINDYPFVLRDVDNLYENLIHTGITTRRVEAMEKQLKRDILEEAKKYGGKILLHDEGEDGNLISFWEQIDSPDNVLTCREMFSQSLLGEQMYHRIPITDEHAPLPETFDQILNLLRDTPPSQYCISWNCQMGRGRTTTGMVICCLLSLHWPGSTVSLEEVPRTATNDREDSALADGFYKIIQNLIRVLPDGPKIKSETDQIIDLCSTMQNLRIAILDMKQRSTSAVTSTNRQAFSHRARDYLIRYFYLIAFNAYLWDCSTTNFATSFQSWIDDRPEITNHLINVQVI